MGKMLLLENFSQNDLRWWFSSACQPYYRQKLFPVEWFGSLIRLTAIAFPRLWQYCGKGFAGAGVVIVLVVHAWERNSTSTLKAPKCPKTQKFPTKVPFVELLFQSPPMVFAGVSPPVVPFSASLQGGWAWVLEIFFTE